MSLYLVRNILGEEERKGLICFVVFGPKDHCFAQLSKGAVPHNHLLDRRAFPRGAQAQPAEPRAATLQNSGSRV